MRGARGAALVLALLGALACSEAPGAESTTGSEPRLLWSQSWGSDGDDFARSLALDAGGNALVTGYSNGVLPGAENAGAWDAFLASFDATGAERWSAEWGSDGPDFGQAVVLDPEGGALVAGYTPGSIEGQAAFGGHDAFLTHFDAAGVRDFTRQVGTDADDYVYAAAATEADAVLVGYTKGAFEGQTNAGAADAFVVRCDAAGGLVWTWQLGTDGTDYAQAVHVDGAGDILVAGYTDGQLGDDLDRGAEDAFLVKLSPSGELLWLRQWGSDTTDYALAVTSDADQNLYVTGYTYGAIADDPSLGGEDGYLTKLDRDGAIVWIRQFGSAQRDSARTVTTDVEGRALVGGDTEGALGDARSAGLRDAFLVRFASDGALEETVQWGGSSADFVLSAAAFERTVLVAGYTETAERARDVLLASWRF